MAKQRPEIVTPPDPLSTVPFEAVLESISDGVFTVNMDWRVTSFNRAAEEIPHRDRQQRGVRAAFGPAERHHRGQGRVPRRLQLRLLAGQRRPP